MLSPRVNPPPSFSTLSTNPWTLFLPSANAGMTFVERLLFTSALVKDTDLNRSLGKLLVRVRQTYDECRGVCGVLFEPLLWQCCKSRLVIVAGVAGVAGVEAKGSQKAWEWPRR